MLDWRALLTRHRGVSVFRTLRDHGRGLKYLREAQSLSAKDLAARLGVAASYLSEVETGKRPLTEGFAERIAAELSLQPGEFVERVIAAGGGFADDAGPPRNVGEEPPPYRVRSENLMTPPAASASCAEMEILARWLFRRLNSAERAESLENLTRQALAGDAEAASAARALLLLIRTEST